MSRADTIDRLRDSGMLTKTLTMYVAIAPDGSRLVKRVFKIDAAKAFMAIYRDRGGRWRASGVRATEAEIFWTDHIVICSRVDQ